MSGSSAREPMQMWRRTEDPLNVVHNNDAQRTLVGVGKDLVEVGDLLVLSETDHVFGRDELDEREVRREGDRRCQSSLSRRRRTCEKSKPKR